MPSHKLLLRQLRRHLGAADAAALHARLDALGDRELAEQVRAFVLAVDQAYVQSDRDLELRTRSLELSSAELTAANERLRRESQSQRRALAHLRDSANTLLRQIGLPPVSDNDDNIEALSTLMAQLLHDREQARHDLQISEARFRSLVANLPGCVYRCINDEQWTMQFLSPPMEQLSGYPVSDFINNAVRSYTSVIHPEDRELVDAGVQAGLAAKTDYTLDYRIVHRDGSVRYVLEKGRGVYNAAGELEYLDGVILDNTAFKQVQLQMQAAREAAEAASRAKSDFLANMSHEIRTPMNGIIGMTELALATELTADQREFLNLVKSSADALLVIVNDILDFSKIEAGKLSLEAIEFSLRRVVGDSLRSLAPRAAERGLELICSVDPQVPDIVQGDPGRLRQLLLNLVGNALKFTPAGEVEVRVTIAGELQHGRQSLQIAVRDTGIGIEEDKQVLIFDAFSQADTSTTRRYGGTGLGLAICTRLAELMGGCLWVSSTVGEGSTFTFTLEVGVAPPERQPPAITVLNGYHVLLAQPNDAQRAGIAEQLRHWGMQVTEAATLADVLAGLQTATPDLLIVDCQLGDAEAGGPVAALSRVQPRLPPLMMLVGQPEKTACAVCSVHACLVKPVSQSDLLDQCLSLLRLADDPCPVLSRVAHPTVRGRSLRILLAEDHPVNQKLAMEVLRRLGHQVELACNGCEAIDMQQEGNFDLVLMDVQMPLLGGLEATARIRELDRQRGRRHQPMIAMTAHAMQGDQERCLEAGLDGYISKPIRQESLVQEIERVVHQFPSPAPAVAATEGGGQFSADAALALLDGDASLLRDLALLLQTVAVSDGEALREAVEQRDFDRVGRLAHRMHGSISMFGASAPTQAARALEGLANQQRGDALPRAWQHFDQEVQGLLQGLQDWLNQHTPDAG